MLAESHEGRPTKIEGNPDHPASLGATDVFAQASVLDLYDPDRSQSITGLGRIRTWGAFVNEVSAPIRALRALGGEGLRFLTGNVTSPAMADQMSADPRRLPEGALASLGGGGAAPRARRRRGRLRRAARDGLRPDQGEGDPRPGHRPPHLAARRRVRYSRDFARNRQVRVDRRTITYGRDHL